MQIGISLHSHIPADWSRIQSREARAAYIEQIRQKIASAPRVSTVAVGIGATPPDADVQSSFIFDGSGDGEQPQARVMLVGQRYFAALRIPLLQGRVWNEDENTRGDFIAVVNHAFATRYLSSSNALGRQLRISSLTPHNHYQAVSAQSAAWRQVIGVVGDARNDGVDQPVVLAIYIPYTALIPAYAQFLVRTEGDPLTCLHSIFCGLRASEVMGLQWKSWTGEALMPYGTAYEGQFYNGRLKTRQSKAPIPVPEQVRPVIEAWRNICSDPSPEALMFPTFGRGKRKGQAVPRWGKNFLTWRIRPIARKLGIPDRLVTFQVMRRTLGTDMQQHGTLKDAQGMLRHASIRTTGDVYVQTIERSVLAAVNSRTSAVLGNWLTPVGEMGLKGRNPKGPEAIRRSSAKPGEEVLASC